MAILRHTPKAACEPLEKLLKSAVANAENNFDMDRENLYVSECYVVPGPTMKRIRPRAQGRAFQVLKRTSHVRALNLHHVDEDLFAVGSGLALVDHLIAELAHTLDLGAALADNDAGAGAVDMDAHLRGIPLDFNSGDSCVIRADIDYGFAEADTTYGKTGVKVWIYTGEVLIRENLDPYLTAALDITGHGDTGGLDLVGGDPGRLERLLAMHKLPVKCKFITKETEEKGSEAE